MEYEYEIYDYDCEDVTDRRKRCPWYGLYGCIFGSDPKKRNDAIKKVGEACLVPSEDGPFRLSPNAKCEDQ